MAAPLPTTIEAAPDPTAQTQLGVEEFPPSEGAAVEGLPSSIGPYQVENVLGRGGMGEVFAVRDFRFDRILALKRLAPFPAPSWHRELFVAEMRVTASLDHPHVVPVLDRGTDEDGRPWFVMPRLQGRPLSTALRDEAFTFTDAMQIFLKICHAVAHAHGRGVFHLDIKPQNVWVGDDGLTYLLDWGLSGAAQPRDDTGAKAVGTPRYCAPEQVDRRVGEVGPRTDVYGLGALLYTLALRRSPPRFAFAQGPLLAEGDVEELRQRVGETAPRVGGIIARATAPLPDARFTSVAELRDEVKALVSASPFVMMIERLVRPGREADYEAWANDINEIAARFPGHESVFHVHMAPTRTGGSSRYLMVARFSSAEHAAAFDASTARREMLARAERLGFEERVRRIDRQGHVSWFHLDTDEPDTGLPAPTGADDDDVGGGAR